MKREDKETLIDLLEDYMWSQTDSETTRQCLSLIEKIQAEME